MTVSWKLAEDKSLLDQRQMYMYLPKKAVVSNTEVIGKEKEGGLLKGI